MIIMPISDFVNTDIIMGYKSPDFSALDPSRMAANALAGRKARMEEQVNALALQEAKQKAADQALLQEAANQSDPVNYLRGLGRLDIANAYAAQQQEQQGKKLQFQTQEQALEDAKRKAANEQFLALAPQRYAELQNISTPEQYMKWHLANPELYGTDKAARTAQIQEALAQEGGLQKQISASKSALETILGIKPAEPKQFQPTAFESEFALYQQDPKLYRQFKEAQKVETGGGATAGTTQIPKLKQGEKWNPNQERVEQVPGSAEYIKQSKLHGTDYGAVQAVNSKTELADKQIDRLLSPANEDAFNNLFGGYGAYVTQQFSGKTADLKSDLDSLKQNLKSAGLELIKSGGGGAIGTITEREWPILEGMIESLSPKMSESDARAKLEAIKAKMANIRAMAADKYDTTWGETQYYKGASAPTAGGGAQTPKLEDPLGIRKSKAK